MPKSMCPCGMSLMHGDINIYRVETWRYNEHTNIMELVYAQCHHGKILINKYLGDKKDAV